jgi:hypothetical protein
MYNPNEGFGGRFEWEGSKKEIITAMSSFLTHYNLKPERVIDCKHGIYYVLPLERGEQKLSEADIEATQPFKELETFFKQKGYHVYSRKFFYTHDKEKLMSRMFRKKKFHVYIGWNYDVTSLAELHFKENTDEDLDPNKY